MVWSGLGYLVINVEFLDALKKYRELPTASTMLGIALILISMLGLIAAYAYSRCLLFMVRLYPLKS